MPDQPVRPFLSSCPPLTRHPARPSPVIPVLVTGINRGTELALIPVTGTGMTRESASGGQTRPNNHPPQTASKHSATDPRI